MFVEVIDGHGITVIGGFWKIRLVTLCRFFLLVSCGVEVDIGRRTRLEIGDFHPDKTFVHHRVEFFDLGGEQGLVISGDKAEITPIFLGCGKVEIPVVESHQHRGRPDGISHGNSIIGCINGNFRACSPGIAPPGSGLKRAGKQHRQGDHGHNASLW